MLTPSSVIQRREPFTSGPNTSVATISAIADREHDQRGAADLPRRQERHADQHHERRQQEHHVAVEEVERIEPDPGRHRRARRQRQDDAAQDQRDDRGQQRACPRSTTSRKTGCVGHGRAWASPNGRGNAHWWLRMVSGGLMEWVSFEMSAMAPLVHVVIPAKAGIQYAAASRLNSSVSGILGHPPPRRDDDVKRRLTPPA